MRRQETVWDSEFGICLGFGVWSLGFQPVFRLRSAVCGLWSVVPHE